MAFPGAVAHEVKEGAQGRDGLSDGAIGEVARRGGTHGADDIFHAISEDRGILGLGLEELLAEEGVGAAEDAAAKRAHKIVGNAPAQATGADRFAFVVPVGATREVAVGDEEFWGAFLGRHPAPELGDEEGDVVIDAILWADPAGGGAEYREVGEDEGDERGVEIVNGREGVEGPFGERAFGAGTGGRGGFSGEARDQIHEGFGQLLVVNRAVDAEGAHAGLGWILSATHENGADREGHGAARRNAAIELRTGH